MFEQEAFRATKSFRDKKDVLVVMLTNNSSHNVEKKENSSVERVEINASEKGNAGGRGMRVSSSVIRARGVQEGQTGSTKERMRKRNKKKRN